jgi:hypothetical protein
VVSLVTAFTRRGSGGSYSREERGVKVIKGNIEAAIFRFPRQILHKNVMLRM